MKTPKELTSGPLTNKLLVFAILAVLASALINSHSNDNASRDPMPIKELLILQDAGASKVSTYFMARWKEYVNATRVKEIETAAQPLEFCEKYFKNKLDILKGKNASSKPVIDIIKVVVTEELKRML